MKNAVLILLVIVAAVLGIFLYKCTKPTWRKAGASHDRTTRDNKAGKAVHTEECPTLLGIKKDVCVIPISYLQDMTPGTSTDVAIEIHPKDTIVWFGDRGETIDEVQMPRSDCFEHAKSNNPGPTTVIDGLSGKGSLRFSHVTDKQDHVGYCYKTTIKVSLNGKQITIDPHTFDGPDSP